MECLEIIRQIRHGAMHPLLCRADDGAYYVVKPFSSGSDWPLVLEWICARLGRAVNLPIPNYRRIWISEELAEAWDAVPSNRPIEPGVGFGSQYVENAIECSSLQVEKLKQGAPDLARRLLAFDWWVRNKDRILENPNLLWTGDARRFYAIDHEQAAQEADSIDLFWMLHLFASLERDEPVWLPEDLKAEFRQALGLRSTIWSELPSEWTSREGNVDSFFAHLTQSLNDISHKDWKRYD